MLSYEPKLHLVVLISKYSNRIANRFEREFEHKPRHRSSYKAEMREINDWWRAELATHSVRSSRLVEQLPVDGDINDWLDAFEKHLIDPIMRYWAPDECSAGYRRGRKVRT